MGRRDLPNAAAVIAGAGTGVRMGGTRKQFRLLGGKPLLVQSALPFQRHPHIEAIAIAVSEGDVEEVSEMCRDHHLSKVVSIVAGGETRQDSVRAALLALPETVFNVLTHDAVRPFVSGREIDRILEALIAHEAAVLAAPVVDTLSRGMDGMVSERVDREGVFRLLTPQGFRREVLGRGHETAQASSKRYSDEVTLVKAIGVDVALVPSSSPNIKITTPADWDLAVWMWPGWAAAEHK